MAYFKYRAMDRVGKLQQGVIEQPSLDAVVDWMAREGLSPIEVDVVSKADKAAIGSGGKPARLSRRRGNQDRILHFTRDLSVMLGAGLPLDKSLTLLEKMADPQGAEMIRGLREDVRKGVALADAFANQNVFSHFYVNMIRAGEASGNLDQALGRMAEYLERSKALKEMVLSALTYPAILLGVAVLSVMLLLGYVVPRFADLFNDMGGQLPLPTRIVMMASDFVLGWWWLLAAGAFLMFIGARHLLSKPGFKALFDEKVLKLPLWGDLVRNTETSRFCRTLGVLLQGGVTMVTALTIARETVSNRVLKEQLHVAETALREGRSLSGTLIAGGHFPLLGMHMIQVGEETGRLEDMLLKVGDIYEGQVSSVIKRLLTFLEPVLILILGVMVAGIIISVLLGILGVNELIG